jgi:hypothetical protein
MNEKSDHNSDVLILMKIFVLKFVCFKNDIKSNVDFLKCTISMDFICSISFIIWSHVLMSKSECFHFGIAIIVLMTGHYLWTMSSNFRIRMNENNVSFILNQWLRLNSEDSIRIEMDYIEKAVKHRNEKRVN